MITENLSTLKIHKLSQEQYDRELAAGNIDANAIYLTPDEIVEDETNSGCYYRMVDGEKEWINPPLLTNVEYRTSERFLNAPVYVQKKNITSIAHGTASKNATISTSSEYVVDIHTFLTLPTTTISVPNKTHGVYVDYSSTKGGNIVVTIGSDSGDINPDSVTMGAVVTVKYVKR